ncbi:MAG: hypothetical protein JW702_02005 [Clostridiales bacterium]|nr:hypothetical protein [Clostridiales bacterium]
MIIKEGKVRVTETKENSKSTTRNPTVNRLLIREESMMKNRILLSIVILIICLSSMAFANSAAPLAADEMLIVFDDQTGIELIEEHLEIIVDSSYEFTDYSVEYLIRNTNDFSIEREIWFISPYDDNESFLAYQSGEELLTVKQEISVDVLEDLNEKDVVFVLPDELGKNNESANFYYGGYHNDYYVEAFVLKMSPGETVQLNFNYQSQNGEIWTRDYIRDLRNQIYLLSPAASFEGDKHVMIELKLPSNAIMGSNLDFEKIEDGQYYWEGSIDKNTDLYLTFGIRWVYWIPKIVYQVIIGIIMIIIIGLKFKYRKSEKIGVLTLISLPTMLYILLIIGSYGEQFIGAAILYFTWPIWLAIFAYQVYKKKNPLSYRLFYALLILLILWLVSKMFFNF